MSFLTSFVALLLFIRNVIPGISYRIKNNCDVSLVAVNLFVCMKVFCILHVFFILYVTYILKRSVERITAVK